MKKVLLVLCCILLIGISIGCTQEDAEDVWTQNIYPATNNTYTIGSPTLQYQNGYFVNLSIGNMIITNFSAMSGNCIYIWDVDNSDYFSLCHDGGVGIIENPTGSIYVRGDHYVVADLTGDSAGMYEFQVENSGNHEVASIDTLGNLDAEGYIQNPNASISASGNITALYFIGNGSQLTGITLTVAANDSTKLEKTQAQFVCDGIADDIQIQAAIDLAGATNRMVRLSEGTFHVSTKITLKPNTVLEGQGKGATNISAVNGLNDDILYLPAGATRNCYGRLEHFMVDGNGAGQTFGSCINLNSTWKWTLNDLYLYDGKECGLEWNGAASPLDSLENTIIDVISNNNGDCGFKFGNSYDNVLMDLYTEENVNDGFAFYSGSNSLYHCHAHANRYGAYIDTGVSIMYLNDFWGDTNEKHGIYDLGNNNRYVAVYSFNNGQDLADTYDGLYMSGDKNIVTGCIFRDTQGSKTQRFGVKIDGNECIVTGNMAFDNSWGGVNVGGGAGNILDNNNE